MVDGVIPISSHPRHKEMRGHPRYALQASILLELRGAPAILPAINISLGGVFVGVGRQDVSGLAVGSVIQVQVFDPRDLATSAVPTPALVVRHEPSGVALSWTGKDRTVESQLDALLQSIASGEGRIR